MEWNMFHLSWGSLEDTPREPAKPTWDVTTRFWLTWSAWYISVGVLLASFESPIFEILSNKLLTDADKW